jgi:uncharacterized membrane protein
MRVLNANSLSAIAIWAGVWGIVCAMIFAAPFLMSSSWVQTGSMLYLCFSGFCHQIPERSLFIWGYPLAVCYRCSGIYLGFFLGSFLHFPRIDRSPIARRICVLAACAPLGLDVLISYLGLWRSSGACRFMTGMLLGIIISPLLVQGAAECLHRASMRKHRLFDLHSREVFHE